MTLPARATAADYFVAPQLGPEHMAEAQAMGFASVVNNRPDQELLPGQPGHAQMQAAAEAAGLQYLYIPTDSSGSNPEHVAQLAAALPTLARPVLAFCRSGGRSASLYLRATQGR